MLLLDIKKIENEIKILPNSEKMIYLEKLLNNWEFIKADFENHTTYKKVYEQIGKLIKGDIRYLFEQSYSTLVNINYLTNLINQIQNNHDFRVNWAGSLKELNLLYKYFIDNNYIKPLTFNSFKTNFSLPKRQVTYYSQRRIIINDQKKGSQYYLGFILGYLSNNPIKKLINEENKWKNIENIFIYKSKNCTNFRKYYDGQRRKGDFSDKTVPRFLKNILGLPLNKKLPF